eukprot:4020107-Amphidinium_carterae.1
MHWAQAQTATYKKLSHEAWTYKQKRWPQIHDLMVGAQDRSDNEATWKCCLVVMVRGDVMNGESRKWGRSTLIVRLRIALTGRQRNRTSGLPFWPSQRVLNVSKRSSVHLDKRIQFIVAWHLIRATLPLCIRLYLSNQGSILELGS